MVSIWPWTILYFSWTVWIHLLVWYGSHYGCMWVKMGCSTEQGSWPRDSLSKLEQISAIWVVLHLLCNLRHYVPYSHFLQLKDCILAKWMLKGYLNGGLTEELYMGQLIGSEDDIGKFEDLSNPSICQISDVHAWEVFIKLIFSEVKTKFQLILYGCWLARG